MLVLARKENQTIALGTSIVRIIEIRGSIVRLGIEADRDVQIVRGELLAEAKPDETMLAEV